MCYYRLEKVLQTGCSNSFEVQTGFAFGMFFGCSIRMDQCLSFHLFDSRIAIYQHLRNASLNNGVHDQPAPSPLAFTTSQHFESFDISVSIRSSSIIPSYLMTNSTTCDSRRLMA